MKIFLLFIALILTADSIAQTYRSLSVKDLKLPSETNSRVLFLNSSGQVKSSSVTDTTLSFLDATSSIQNQIDNANAAISTNAADITTKQDTLGNSAGLAAALNDETGTGLSVFSVSPALTGVPTVPTASPGDNSTRAASTAYVDTGLATKQNTLANSAGLASALSDETGTGFAVFSASPALTGSPTAPTQTASDNSTKVATTAYVDGAISTHAATNVNLTGDQSVSGIKTFTGKIVASTTTSAFSPCPTMTTTQRDALSATNGECIYNSSTGTLQFYILGAWTSLSTASSSTGQIAGDSYFAGTTNCTGWTRTSTTMGAFAADADCPGPTIVKSVLGTWETTDSNLPRQTVTSLPAGTYLAKFHGISQFMSAINASAITIFDGSTSCEPQIGHNDNTGTPATSVECVFTYATSGTRNFELYGGSSAGTMTVSNGITTPRNSLKFSLYYVGGP